MANILTGKKPKLRVMFGFGKHETEGDFEKHKPLIEKFKPDVYGRENSLSKKSERSDVAILEKQFHSEWNRAKEILADNPTGFNALSILFKTNIGKANVGNAAFPEFSNAEDMYALEQDVIAFPLEAHDSFAYAEISDSATTAYKKANDIYQLLAREPGQSREPELMRQTVKSLLASFELDSIANSMREHSIVMNIHTYVDDLLSVHPQFASKNEIRLYASFGTRHFYTLYPKAVRAYACMDGYSFEKAFASKPSEIMDVVGTTLIFIGDAIVSKNIAMLRSMARRFRLMSNCHDKAMADALMELAAKIEGKARA